MTTHHRPWSSFGALVSGIGKVNGSAILAVGRQAQQVLALRNWIVGAWIVHYEQKGADRAAYGSRLLPRLAASLAKTGQRGFSARNLANFRLVALAYPTLDIAGLGARALPGKGSTEILQTSAELLLPVPDGDLPWRDEQWVGRLFTELTFSHLLELARIDDPIERAFYELHTLKEGWAVRELVRQRNAMLYQRVGLSTDRDAVLALPRQGVLDRRPSALVRDPYVLEFLGLGSRELVDESRLEQAMIEHIQRVLGEFGREFCFVAQQLRITVGNRHHHLDLLFFHRGLRCLVAVELKITEFRPEHYGQMKFYLNYLAEEETLPGENPPVGILLCSGKDEETVHFTTPGTDDSVMVARYLLELPDEEQLKQWLHEARAATAIRTSNGAQP